MEKIEPVSRCSLKSPWRFNHKYIKKNYFK